MSTYLKHYNHNHSPINGKFISGPHVLTEDEKKNKKLVKKWDYIRPDNKKQAHIKIAKKALLSGTAIGAGQVGTQMYINKKILNKPIKSAFNKKTAKRATVLGIATAISNMAYDEFLYLRKGVIRK